MSNIKYILFTEESTKTDFFKQVKSCKSPYISFVNKLPSELEQQVVEEYLQDNDIIIPLVVNLDESGEPLCFLNTCYWQPVYNQAVGEFNKEILLNSIDSVLYGTIFKTDCLKQISSVYNFLYYQDILLQLIDLKIKLVPKVFSECKFPKYNPETKKLVLEELKQIRL